MFLIRFQGKKTFYDEIKFKIKVRKDYVNDISDYNSFCIFSPADISSSSEQFSEMSFTQLRIPSKRTLRDVMRRLVTFYAEGVTK